MTLNWVPIWTAAPMNVWAADCVLPGFYNQTIREVVRVGFGGSRIRIRLSNEFGHSPILVQAVHVALSGEAGSIQPLTNRPVTFGGEAGGAILPGAPLLSDPVDLAVSALSNLSVSVCLKGHAAVETHHYEAQQTTYISVPGNFAGAERMPVEQTTTSRYFLSRVYAESTAEARAVVCFGDSITDGYGSRIDGDGRWPDRLAERLKAHPEFEEIAVLNQGIGGNRILHDQRGSKALERLDRDVLSLRGVSHLVILEGINDIGWPNTALAGANEVVSAAQIIAGLKQLAERARVAGLKVLLGTITPFAGTMSDAPLHAYHTPEKERMRQSVNAWIRDGGFADGVLDFDTAVRDPERPQHLRPAFDSGDRLHPNDAGYQAMADCVDLNLFRL
jgi:lysophospholipase L1-like esterase